MKRLIAGLVVLVVIIAVAVGLGLRARHAGPEIVAAGTPPVSTAIATPSTPVAPAPLTPMPVVAKPAPPPAPPEFAFERVDVETAKPTAEACLVFSRKLDPAVHYEEYLVLAPAAKPALRIDGQRLCLAGLAFGVSYQAELRDGFPAADGLKLPAGRKVEVGLRDRPPLLAFRDGLILPRENSEGVPITSINIDRIAMKLMRVPERLLSQISRSDMAERVAWPSEITDIGEQKATLLWQGEMTVKAARNETVTTLFPLRQALTDTKPGVYVLVAEDAAKTLARKGDDDNGSDERQRAIQWVIDSDIALTSFEGADGLHVFARSLARAEPMAGLRLTLVARNNDELAQAVTDSDGHVRFDPGLVKGPGAAAADAVMAFGADGDFTFQDVTRPAFDLSDRGVDGRALPGPVDAFVYADRGIYRPRETVQLVALLRDRLANAIPATPITLVVQRPDGAAYRRVTLADQANGAVHFPVTLTETAPHGHWTVNVYLDPKGEPIGTTEFDVEDFIPQRLKVTVSSKAEYLRPGDGIALDAEARFLYGAPAAGLEGESQATVTADPQPFAAYRGYHFGLAQQKFEDKQIDLKVAETDAQGKAQVTGALTDIGETSLPLRASIRVAIFEPGGRSTDETISLPVRTRPLLLGIHPLFDDDTVQEDSEAAFEIAALDESGKPVAKPAIDYALVKEVTEYTWYKTDRGYRFEHATHDVPVVDGTIDVSSDKPGAFRHAVPWGYYRLTVHDKESGAATSYRFSAGWTGVLAEDRPDKAEVSADKPRYAIGDTARIAIRPPAAGEALVVIANDRILATKMVTVPADGATVEIPVTAAWGTGAYAIVASYRALGDGNDRAPVRAIGLSWLPIDAGARTLSVALDLPDRSLPRRKLDVPITVKGAGDKAFVTLAAVDEGILQLTKFVAPSPTDFYFGKRRLAVDIRDDYGRLIDAKGVLGTIRSGGDIGGRALDVVPTKTVALFSGLVALDASGHASIPIEIPDFNGDLRFMAVAFDGAKVGETAQHLIVRDPVVADVTLPRFLAPGDKSRLSLDLHNLDGGAGSYHAKFVASGAVAFPEAAERAVDLAVGQRQLIPFPLDGTGTGIGTIDLHVSGPDNFAVDRQWQIAVRAPQLPISRETVATLPAGKDTKLDAQALKDFLPGTGVMTVSFDSVRTVPIAGLLRSLDRYPFGCVEQVTSRAYPLLYFNDVALFAGAGTDRGAAGRVQDAIDTLLDMQREEGNFGLWAQRGDEAKDWLSVYALDFLTAAATKQYHIPTDAFDRGRNWLRGVAQNKDTEIRTRLYAAYVLSRNEAVSLPDLRYIFDANQGQKGNNAFAESQLGAALAFEGDRARAQAAFVRAEKLPLAPRNQPFFHSYDNTDYYASALRDWAGFLTMASEAGETGIMARLFDRYQWVNEDSDELTTQEKAWLLLAMNAITRHRAPVALQVNGEAMNAKDRAITLTPDAAGLAKGYTVRNVADRDVWETVSIQGTPSAPLPPAASGITLSRDFWALDGKPASLASIQQNDRLIVTLRGATADQRHHEIALLDLLPAGFEIEGPVRADDDGKTSYPWLGNLRAMRLVSARDDRFVASFVVHPDDRSVIVQDQDKEQKGDYLTAYVVRAITPGSYVLPAAIAEDMYRPAILARTAMGSVTVAPRE
jgi:alpha-2-macroglobulin